MVSVTIRDCLREDLKELGIDVHTEEQFKDFVKVFKMGILCGVGQTYGYIEDHVNETLFYVHLKSGHIEDELGNTVDQRK